MQPGKVTDLAHLSLNPEHHCDYRAQYGAINHSRLNHGELNSPARVVPVVKLPSPDRRDRSHSPWTCQIGGARMPGAIPSGRLPQRCLQRAGANVAEEPNSCVAALKRGALRGPHSW